MDGSTNEAFRLPPSQRRTRSCEPDLEVIVGSDTSAAATEETKKTFHCHSVILATHSTFFDTILATNMMERSQKVVHLPEELPETFRSALSYLDSPTKAHSLKLVDMMKVAPFYDKYGFDQGMALFETVFISKHKSLLLISGKESSSWDDAELTAYIGAVALAKQSNLTEILQHGIEYFSSYLQLSTRAIAGFQEHHFRQLYPLLDEFSPEVFHWAPDAYQRYGKMKDSVTTTTDEDYAAELFAATAYREGIVNANKLASHSSIETILVSIELAHSPDYTFSQKLVATRMKLDEFISPTYQNDNFAFKVCRDSVTKDWKIVADLKPSYIPKEYFQQDAGVNGMGSPNHATTRDDGAVSPKEFVWVAPGTSQHILPPSSSTAYQPAQWNPNHEGEQQKPNKALAAKAKAKLQIFFKNN